MESDQQFIAFNDLQAWMPSDKTIAVLGNEAGFHAALHRAALGTLVALHPQLNDWKIFTVEANSDNLREVVQQLHHKKVWGVVLTRPLKSEAIKLLTLDIMTQPNQSTYSPIGTAESLAERVGAVNLMMWRPNGYWGISTDGICWSKTVENHLGIKLKGKTMVVVGAGALARAIAVEALQKGCRELWIGNRSQENAWDAIDQILPSINMRGRTHSFNLIKPSAKVPTNALIINTLPLEARGAGNPALDLARFDRNSLYFDCEILNTPSHKIAEEKSMPHSNGAYLWAYQLIEHIELLVGVAPSFDFVHWTVSEAAASRHL